MWAVSTQTRKYQNRYSLGEITQPVLWRISFSFESTNLCLILPISIKRQWPSVTRITHYFPPLSLNRRHSNLGINETADSRIPASFTAKTGYTHFKLKKKLKKKKIADNAGPCLYLSGATFHTTIFFFNLESIITKTKILIFLLKFCLLFYHQSLVLTVFMTHSWVP